MPLGHEWPILNRISSATCPSVTKDSTCRLGVHVAQFAGSGSRIRVALGNKLPLGLPVPQRAPFACDVTVRALGDGRFQPRDVRTGIESEDRVEILEGLSEGQIIVGE